MRVGDVRTGELSSYVDLEARVRKDHPLRAIRQIVNEALVLLEQDFAALLFTDRATVDRARKASARAARPLENNNIHRRSTPLGHDRPLRL